MGRVARTRCTLLHSAKASSWLEVWRVHCDGCSQSCEIRDNSRVGAGWEVMVLEHCEPLFSRQCANEQRARYVAEGFKKELLRSGWSL